MRVLVTGGTGLLGAPICRELALRGADVIAMARRPAPRLPAGVRFLAGDTCDPAAVEAAIQTCGGLDALVHLAWHRTSGRQHPAEQDDLAGARNVLSAARDRGVGRLVVGSSVLQERLVKSLIEKSEAPALIVCTAPVLGRGVRSVITDQLAGPVVLGAAGAASLRQFVHQDDVTRFFCDALTSTATGAVDLAADDVLHLAEVARLLGKRFVQLPRRIARAALQPWPIADTSRLRGELGFRCAWSSADAVVDTRRSLITYVHLGPINARRRSYVPFTEPGWRPDMSPWPGHELRAIGPADYRGEFDDDIDPEMGTFTATNVGEAYPDPMTPLSLGVGLLSLRAGAESVARMVGLDGLLAHETQARSTCSFAHRIYLNVSIMRGVFDRMPDSAPEQADAQYLGKPLPPDYKRPALTSAELKAAGTVMRKGGAAMARIGLSESWLLHEAERLARSGGALDRFTDAQLDARISLLIDTFADSQVVNGCAQVLGAAALSAAESRGGAEAISAGSLASARTLQGVRRVAGLIRDNSQGQAVLDKYRADPEAMQRFAEECPVLYEALDDLLASLGHRGPGGFELANATFADKPALLFDAILQAAAAEPSPEPIEPVAMRRHPLERIAGAALRRRERVRDASIRIFHQLRMALREKGDRLTAAGQLPDRDAVFYLGMDEIFHPPADAAERVARRRAERERLASIETPALVDGDWLPVAVSEAEPITKLTGAGVSRGVVQGTVRVLTDPDDGVEPGEILVCRVTDIGWTPLFAAAAAVISEVGGVMSHSAIVAREFEIPAVVGVERATKRLPNGQLVEVDGGSGTVTVISEEAIAK